jgi:hypothetical protein
MTTNVQTLFLNASRQKTRFESLKGLLTIEDLWDLPLTSGRNNVNLDDIARAYHKQLKEADGEVSFVKPSTKSTDELQAKFDIVKFIIDTKVGERDASAVASAKAETKQKLMGVLARRQDADLEGKSTEELQALIDSL